MHEHIVIVSWYAACATADQLHYFMHSKWIEKKQKIAHDYFEARNFRGTLISFILNNFEISWHFNFAV